MNAWNLPTSVHVAGVDWDIRTDFRIVIDCLIAFDNPDYEDDEKWLYCLMSLVKDFDDLAEDNYMEMCLELSKFIDMGIEPDNKKNPRKLMDWEQDANYIISAINKVANHDVRNDSNLHWWTFLSHYMEIDNKSIFSHILSIREKKAKGKKLEKWEQEYYRENKSLVDIKEKLTDEELAEEKLLEELFG